MAPCRQDSREQFLAFCACNHYVAVNTLVAQNATKLLTYRSPRIQHGASPYRKGYDQLDYILAPSRWKHTAVRAHAVHSQDIYSDHYPLTAVLDIRLHRSAPKPRPPPPPSYQGNLPLTIIAQFQRDIRAQSVAARPTTVAEWTQLIHKVTSTLPIPAQRARQDYISAHTWQLMEERKTRDTRSDGPDRSPSPHENASRNPYVKTDESTLSKAQQRH